MLTLLVNKLKKEGEFSNRIKYRHGKFWGSPDAENIRNIFMNADDPIEKWKNMPHWQRKLSNKYNAREFARMHCSRVPELYRKGSHFNTSDVNHLPAQYVIRPTTGHSSNLVFLMNNGFNMMDKKTYAVADIIEIITHEAQNRPGLEFLFEEFIRTEKGEYQIPIDYKIYCFNGRVACIGVISRLSRNNGFVAYYNEKWEPLKPVNGVYNAGISHQQPKCLEEMLDFAKLMSISYEIFVRIDMYATDKGAVFGEFTPTPGRGGGYTRYGEKLLLPYWDTYCRGMI